MTGNSSAAAGRAVNLGSQDVPMAPGQ
jgi:hypothetical protein